MGGGLPAVRLAYSLSCGQEAQDPPRVGLPPRCLGALPDLAAGFPWCARIKERPVWKLTCVRGLVSEAVPPHFFVS